MIIGVGTDIVQIERIKKSVIRTKSFMIKAFTEDELAYIEEKNNRYESIAGLFAAKEAVSKAIGTGFRQFSLHDIEILHDELGKPKINLDSKIINNFSLEKCIVHVSISHSADNAIAFAVLEGGN